MSRMRGSSLEIRCTYKGRPRHSMGSDPRLCRYRPSLANYPEVLTAENLPNQQNLPQEPLLCHLTCAFALRVLFRPCNRPSSNQIIPTPRAPALKASAM